MKIYKNNFGKQKIDFNWSQARYPIRGISMTDQSLYDKTEDHAIEYDEAYIVISIPKKLDDWVNPNTGEQQAYKFVSKIFEI